MKTLKETKYLRFIDVEAYRQKTKIISIVNIHHDEVIGEIKWFSKWRQYCFSPNFNTIWNKECLEDVNSIIKELMDERKPEKKAKPAMRTIGVITLNLKDFMIWRREKHHYKLNLKEDTLRRYIYRNKRYVCFYRAIHVCGYNLDEIIETSTAYQNPEYNKILEYAKPALKVDGKWLSTKVEV